MKYQNPEVNLLNIMFSKYLLISLIFIAANLQIVQSEEIETLSPDKKILISFLLDNEGVPLYRMSFGGRVFVNWSRLGLNFIGTGLLGKNLKLVSVNRKTIIETYEIISGKSKYGRNYCNETKILLEENSGDRRKIEIYFRGYNDGAAFRYGIPEQNSINEFILSTEETYINFAGDYTAWAMKKNKPIHSYEGEYLKYKLSKIYNAPGDSLKDFPLVTLPLTIEINPEFYITFTEANITDYAGMHLIYGGTRYSFKSMLSTDTNNRAVSVRGKSPAVSPWRVFIIGETPGDLIESNIIMNLNEPSEIPDAHSWIKPGKSTWSWWAEDRGFDPNYPYYIISTDVIKYYIDFAASNSIEYVTIDAGWYGWMDATKNDNVHDVTKPLPECDLPYLATYANSKGVGLIVWVLWYEFERQMIDALDYYSRLGIKGIKVDFMDREDQDMINFYHTTAKECAKRKLIVTFHGAYKPDGFERTYPNILTIEGIMGNEWTRNSSGLPDPEHNVTVPFTRMVAGPMDFTPGSMTNVTKQAYVGRWKYPMTKGTRMQQIAMTVVYQSGILSLCESPKIYEQLAEFNFIKQVPASWDSTIVLSGEIGEYISMARKKGNNWFAAAMTDWTERDITVNFDFLDNASYSAEIYADASDANTNPQNVRISKATINNEDIRDFHLAKGGGLAIVLKKR